MQIFPLFAAVAATGVSPVVDVDQVNAGNTRLPWVARQQEPLGFAVQVEISNTASVQIQGRLSDDHGWTILDTLTASGIKFYSTIPQLRLEVSAFTSGTVTASASV